MSGLVAIHQPNFFPWLGYFDKIRRADVFIFLDQVAYPRAGSGGMGSWVNRVRLNIQGEARWITCPLQRMTQGAPILAAAIDDKQFWRRNLVRTLETNYRRARRFDETMALLRPLIEAPRANLAAFNISATGAIAARLGANARFVRQSELPHEGAATALLVSLVKAVGGDAYLAGGGAEGYQQDELFEAHGLRLVAQNFMPASYGPAEAWLPGLSAIDYLMHDGRPLEEAFPDPPR
jgi:WbqC-like protein family